MPVISSYVILTTQLSPELRLGRMDKRVAQHSRRALLNEEVAMLAEDLGMPLTASRFRLYAENNRRLIEQVRAYRIACTEFELACHCDCHLRGGH